MKRNLAALCKARPWMLRTRIFRLSKNFAKNSTLAWFDYSPTSIKISILYQHWRYWLCIVISTPRLAASHTRPTPLEPWPPSLSRLRNWRGAQAGVCGAACSRHQGGGRWRRPAALRGHRFPGTKHLLDAGRQADRREVRGLEVIHASSGFVARDANWRCEDQYRRSTIESCDRTEIRTF